MCGSLATRQGNDAAEQNTSGSRRNWLGLDRRGRRTKLGMSTMFVPNKRGRLAGEPNSFALIERKGTDHSVSIRLTSLGKPE